MGMGTEIERKFLVTGEQWREGAKVIHTCQGYLATSADCTVRVRVQEDKAYLTIKGRTEGVSRLEYEYPIPVTDANELLERLCQQPYIEKIRHEVMHAGRKWEVDEFLKENQGLIVAEIELESDDQQIDLPPWVGEEVSDDPRYRNSNLVRHPYSQWEKK
jgi:adenylate cyclase